MTNLAKQNTTVNENVAFPVIEQTPNNTLTGTFIGIGDGFHKVEAVAKVISVESGAPLEDSKNLTEPMLLEYSIKPRIMKTSPTTTTPSGPLFFLGLPFRI